MTPSPAGRPRTKPTEERRDDLLKSAERAFLEKGVEQTTIEDITTGADVSKGAFYLHFSSKADVVEAMRARFVEDLLNRIDTAVADQPEDDWRGKVTAWAKACATGYLDASRLHSLVFSAAPLPSRTGLTRNGLVDRLTELLAAGCQEEAWSLKDPSFTAIFLFNALHGVVDQPGIAGDSAARARLLENMDGHFQRLIG